MVEAKTFTVDVHAQVEITITDPDVIERVTGRGGDEWRAWLYDLRTEDDVLEHLALNAVRNGVTSAKQLDGWADAAEDAATFIVAPDAEAEVDHDA